MRLQNKIVNWLSEYINQNKLSSFVIGISGGIDSALTSTLCAMTGKKTILLSLPINQNSQQLERAKKHIEWLSEKFPNTSNLEINLTQTFNSFKSLFTENTDLSLANSKSRLRMTTLYHISSIHNGIVVGTGNKVEDFGVGFFTKYGDGGVDVSPIADLTKTEVRNLAKELGVLDEIVTAKPTDGLWDDDRTDEDQIGATYEELEWAMSYDGELLINKRQREVIEIYQKLHKINSHKMRPIPIFKK